MEIEEWTFMSNKAYIASESIITSLGFSTEENFEKLRNGLTGISLIENTTLSKNPFFGSAISSQELDNHFSIFSNPLDFTRLEKLLIYSISNAISKTDIDVSNKDSLIIISTSKGNIDILDKNLKLNFDKKRAFLWEMGNLIRKHFNNPNTPVIISNACVSGVLALQVGSSLIKTKKFKNVIVTGGDILEYAITVDNNGNSTAYDVNIVDALPSEVAFHMGFVPTASIDLAPAGTFSATPDGLPAGPLVWGRDNGDDSLDIPAGSRLVLTYRTQVLESTATTFTNEVWIDWTSAMNLAESPVRYEATTWNTASLKPPIFRMSARSGAWVESYGWMSMQTSLGAGMP